MNKDNIFKLFSLENKVAIITGGAGMLGMEYAKALVDAGANVILFDHLPISEIKKRIGQLQKTQERHIHAISIDITNAPRIKNAVKAIVKKYKNVDILINNAALTDISSEGKKHRFDPPEEFPLELWKREIEVSLNGAFICTQAVVPHMKRQKSGVIVNISSTHGVVAPDNRIYGEGRYKPVTYPVVKSAVFGATRGWASYLAPFGIRVNALVPGGVGADYMDQEFLKQYNFRTMMGRMARKDEYKGAMLFLCSEASSYMTGASIIVDGGWTAW